MQSQKVIIVGGGFGGIRTALDLVKTPGIEITLISNNPHFEYYPGLHKIVGVSQHATYEIPLTTIFKEKPVTVLVAPVTAIDPVLKTVVAGGQTLNADNIVIAVGSQTEYFGIPGLEEQSFGFKSVAEAKRLRAHVEDMFRKHVHSEKSELVIGLRMVIVGGGPNGVDLAGELAVLSKKIAARYKISESLMTIDLVEAGPRLLPMLPQAIGEHVENRLRELGVNIMCNRELKEQDSWTIEFSDMKIGSKTLIWTAGITANNLIKNIPGVTLGKKNRVVVDDHLQAQGFSDVFIIGDNADTTYSGLAQTAIYDGQYVARVIRDRVNGKTSKPYTPKPNAFNIGAGPYWSVMMIGNWITYGLFPYIMRTLIDIKFFLSLLPAREVWKLYFK